MRVGLGSVAIDFDAEPAQQACGAVLAWIADGACAAA
jgi:hypothetical protein